MCICGYLAQDTVLPVNQLHFKHAKSSLSNVVSHLLLVYDFLCFGLFVCLFVF